MPFGNPKKKIHNIHMNINKSKYLRNMFIGGVVFEKFKKNHFKRTFENKVQF